MLQPNLLFYCQPVILYKIQLLFSLKNKRVIKEKSVLTISPGTVSLTCLDQGGQDDAGGGEGEHALLPPAAHHWGELSVGIPTYAAQEQWRHLAAWWCKE